MKSWPVCRLEKGNRKAPENHAPCDAGVRRGKVVAGLRLHEVSLACAVSVNGGRRQCWRNAFCCLVIRAEAEALVVSEVVYKNIST